jgi:hypothetical protein
MFTKLYALDRNVATQYLWDTQVVEQYSDFMYDGIKLIDENRDVT